MGRRSHERDDRRGGTIAGEPEGRFGVSATGRLDLPPESEWSADQKDVAERMSAGPRGGLSGPFLPLMHAPELMMRVQQVGEYLRFGSHVPDDLFEVAVLTTARHWSQAFEWEHHRALALKARVPSSVIDDVAAEQRPGSGRPEFGHTWDFVHALLTTGEVPDSVYARLERLGTPVVVELITTVGYYTTLGLILNVARIPAPSGAVMLPVHDTGVDQRSDATA